MEIKVTIDHNNDIVTIAPTGSKERVFNKVKDTSMVEGMFSELFNALGSVDLPLNLELETINEEHRKSDFW